MTPETDWTNTGGAFRQMAFGARKVGRIAASGEALEEPELTEPLPDWLARPDWIRAEGIRGFTEQPLIDRGDVLGVLAVFARQSISSECMGWLRMIADHVAAAINKARAFAEIEALHRRLELENEYLREEVTGTEAFGELIGQSPGVRTGAQIRQLEANNIRVALKAANGQVSGAGGAAQLLGLKPTTLASRIKSLGITLRPTADG